MKVSGPGSKVPAQDVGAEAPDAVKDSGGAAFTEAVGKVGAGVDAPDAPAAGRTAGTHAVADIGAELESGRITAKIAVDRVIERVIDRQVGVNAPPGVRERVGAALRQALEDDPLLAEKLRELL